jgi:hypothetical protein
VTSSERKIEFLGASAEQWRALVNIALYTSAERLPLLVEELAGPNQSKQTLKRKIDAIRSARDSGLDVENILAHGQSKILSLHRRNGHREPQRMLRWRVSQSLAAAVQSDDPSADQEEPLVNRLVRVCKLRTSEELWEFFLSVFADVSDAELMNLAGVHDDKKKAKKPSAAKV